MGGNYAAVLVGLAASVASVASLHCIQADNNITAQPTTTTCPDCIVVQNTIHLREPFLCLTNCTLNYFRANDTNHICLQFPTSKAATLTDFPSDKSESTTISMAVYVTSAVRVMAPETRRTLCLPCHPSCKSCDGPSANDCLLCPDNSQLVNRTCDAKAGGQGTRNSETIFIGVGVGVSLLLLAIATILVVLIHLRRLKANLKGMSMDDVKAIPLRACLLDSDDESGVVFTDDEISTNRAVKSRYNRSSKSIPDQERSTPSQNTMKIDTYCCDYCSVPSSSTSFPASSDSTDRSFWAGEAGQNATKPFSQQGDFMSHLILCPEWQAVGTFGQAGGCLQKLNSDVALHVPPQAVAAGEAEIRLAVSTDLGKVRELLGLPDDVEVVTPFVECWTESAMTFQRPVTLCLPHFLPAAYNAACVQVYHVTKCNEDIKICMVPSENLNSSKDAPREAKDSVSSTEEVCTFRIKNSKILISTDHFCGFCACSRKVTKLRQLFAVGSARAFPFNTDWHVDLTLHLWDERINIADFLENEQIPKGEKARICLLEDCSSKSCTMIVRFRSCPVSQGTLLPRLDVNSIPFYDLEQRRPLSQLLACKKCRTKGKFKPVPFKWALKYEQQLQHRYWRTDVEFGVDIMHRENTAVPIMFNINIGEDKMTREETGLQPSGATADNHSSSSVDLRQTLRSMTTDELGALTQHLDIKPRLRRHQNLEFNKEHIIDLCFERYSVVQLADVIVKLASRTATSEAVSARSRPLPVQETKESTTSAREATENTCVKRFHGLNSTSTMESFQGSATDVKSEENTDAKRLADCDYQMRVDENTEMKQLFFSTTIKKKIAQGPLNDTTKFYNQCSDKGTDFVKTPTVHAFERSSCECFPSLNLNIVNGSMPSLVHQV